uniref:Crustin n=1 Tax=Macrobrachium rosenbergii TaxID=79674 RepID=B8LG64_MACRS|nr:crustin [Macrobrachium rosenbergii]
MRFALALVSLCLLYLGSGVCAVLGEEHDVATEPGAHRLPRGASRLSCPPVRRMCLSDRTFRAPKICQADQECVDDEKCCPDVCVKDNQIRKPGI